MTATVDNRGGNRGVVMVPQPHGGALRHGASVKGAGRKPDKVRRALKRMLNQHVAVLGHIAAGVTTEFVEDGKQVLVTPKPSDRVAAIKLMLEYTRGQQVGANDVADRLKRQIDVILSRDTWTSLDLIAALHDIWR